MNKPINLEELLKWRLKQAEADAPAPPRAARLLELARPWWEAWPVQFQSLVERLGRMQVAYGHAMTEPVAGRGGHPVPVVVVSATGERETSARVLYFSAREGRLRLRFQLEAALPGGESGFEATLIANANGQRMLSASVTRSLENEYRVDTELSPALTVEWGQLKVTDRLPFGLILRPEKVG
ncbi:MAG TPA: hypothetical protein VHH73_00010 [Verrucomicrobiae bacterium]|nr:hypothetical protein [Verrucomicrobiae bacterium]